MAAWLLNLGFAGGSAPDVWDKNSFFIPFENRTLIVYRGVPTAMQVNLDVDAGPKKIKIDWSEWLNGSTIASVTWLATPTSITISNTSFTAAGVLTAYINTTTDQLRGWVKATITTSDTVAEVESRSIRVVTTRTT